MAEFSYINLCDTVENRPRYTTLPCAVPRMKTTPLYRQIAEQENLPDYAWDTAHDWDDRAGGLNGGACIRCGKKLKDVRVRINPKTGEPVRRGSLARAIGQMAADVPPVRFVGQ
jgi:hypothetical protein